MKGAKGGWSAHRFRRQRDTLRQEAAVSAGAESQDVMNEQSAARLTTQKKTMGDKEACVACKFIWELIKERVDKETALVDDVGAAFEQSCQDAPDVFYDGCDFMYEQAGDMIQDFLAGTSASGACSKAGLCF